MRFLIAAVLALSLIVSACTSDAPDAAAPVFQEPVDVSPGQPVTAIVIEDSSCAFCQRIGAAVNDLEVNGGVAFGEVTTLERNSSEAAGLIERFNISRVPALLFSEELASYPQHAAALTDAGQEPVDGFYILTAPPVYVETGTGDVRGEVNITFLEDASCAECFDVRLMRTLVERQDVVIVSERTLDVSSGEGQGLVEKYGIEAAPTIVLTGDLGAYPQFVVNWQQVGTIHSDGSLVFRNMAALGSAAVYRNLETGEVVANG